MPTTYNNWDPRIGVAFQPKFLPHTSFRAGFGIFTPRWSLQNRPYVVTSKPAIEIGLRRDCFTLPHSV
jgi:hypothetical protein